MSTAYHFFTIPLTCTHQQLDFNCYPFFQYVVTFLIEHEALNMNKHIINIKKHSDYLQYLKINANM